MINAASKKTHFGELSQSDLVRVMLGNLAGEDWRLRQAFLHSQNYPLREVCDVSEAFHKSQNFDDYTKILPFNFRHLKDQRVHVFVIGDVLDLPEVLRHIKDFLGFRVLLRDERISVDLLKGHPRKKLVDGQSILQSISEIASNSNICTIGITSYELGGNIPQKFQNYVDMGRSQMRLLRGVGKYALFDMEQRVAVFSVMQGGGKRSEDLRAMKTSVLIKTAIREVLFLCRFNLCFLSRCVLNPTAEDDPEEHSKALTASPKQVVKGIGMVLPGDIQAGKGSASSPARGTVSPRYNSTSSTKSGLGTVSSNIRGSSASGASTVGGATAKRASPRKASPRRASQERIDNSRKPPEDMKDLQNTGGEKSVNSPVIITMSNNHKTAQKYYDEIDASLPLRLCPCCARKLHYLSQSDPLDRMMRLPALLNLFFRQEADFMMARAIECGCPTHSRNQDHASVNSMDPYNYFRSPYLDANIDDDPEITMETALTLERWKESIRSVSGNIEE